MNLLNFIKEFPDEESCKLKFKEIRDSQGIVLQIVGVRNIIGKAINGNMNVRPVVFVPLCEVVQ